MAEGRHEGYWCRSSRRTLFCRLVEVARGLDEPVPPRCFIQTNLTDDLYLVLYVSAYLHKEKIMTAKRVVERMKREDRRKRILDAAMTVFIEKGFNRSTTLEIAEAAGISEVTLFRYFSSKREIFLEGVEPILFSILEGSIHASIDLSAEAQLEYVLYERIRLISSNYRVVRLILEEASLLSELGTGSFISRILQILRTMPVQAGVSIRNKEFVLRLLMGSILSFLYMPERNEETIKKYVSEVVALIVTNT
jgi:AcrR family transcriptional regulator